MRVLLAACRVHRPSLRYSNRGSLQMSDTAERVKKIVVEHLGVDESKVTDNASFVVLGRALLRLGRASLGMR